MHTACSHRTACFLLVFVFMFWGNCLTRADRNNKFYVRTDWRFYGESAVYLKAGTDCLEKGDLQGAIKNFDTAIRIDKTIWPAYLDRASAYLQLRKFDLALRDCNEAARLKPQFFRTFISRADVYEALGRCNEGVADLDKVISFHANDETDALALAHRAWIRATCHNASARDPKRALEDATQACKLSGWHMSDYISTLAVAYAANGDFNSAIQYQKRAIDSGRLLPDDLRRAQTRLALYQKHQAVSQ